ncbi:hypothetical protein BDN72DRAFT_857914 [Pluteus cervinus]|uniref:Uncharacterized protein n=1 Tax=Pluteus cervinus TaxID=181527 RepID=A0ACD3AUX0_9AGAR|nr:hypothetical protein BDN72DRAFT_857914 [Pluteus cervinus]
MDITNQRLNYGLENCSGGPIIPVTVSLQRSVVTNCLIRTSGNIFIPTGDMPDCSARVEAFMPVLAMPFKGIDDVEASFCRFDMTHLDDIAGTRSVSPRRQRWKVPQAGLTTNETRIIHAPSIIGISPWQEHFPCGSNWSENYCLSRWESGRLLETNTFGLEDDAPGHFSEGILCCSLGSMCPSPCNSSGAMFPSDTTAYPAHPRLDQIVQSPGHPHNTNILLLYAPFLNLIPRQGTYLPNNLCSMGLFNTTPEVFPAAHFPTQGWVQCDPLYPSEDYNAPHQQANSAQDKQPGPTSESSIYNQDPYDPVYAAWSPLEEQPGSTFSHAEEVPPVSWQVGNPATIPDYHPIWQSGSRASTEAAVQHLPGFDHDRFDEAGISLAVNVEAPPQLYRHSHRASSSSLWDCSEMVPDIEMNTTVQEQCRSSTPSLTSIPAVVSEVPEATSPRPTCRLSEQQISTPQHESEVISLGSASSSPIPSTSADRATPPVPTLQKNSKKKQKKHRIAACYSCQQRKTACGGPQADGQTCRPCAKKNRQCAYPNIRGYQHTVEFQRKAWPTRNRRKDAQITPG